MLRKLLILIGCMAAMAMIVAACGTDDDDTPDVGDDTAAVTPDAATPDAATTDATPDDATPDDATPDAATPEATPTDDDTDGEATQYTVILTEDDDIEVRNGDLLDDLGITTMSLASGPVTFSVVNESENAHTLVIEPRDMDDDATPTMDGDMMEMEETVQAGETATWEVTLQPGEYVLYSREHRDDGMEIEFDVDEHDDD
jgi:hypothetical protein